MRRRQALTEYVILVALLALGLLAAVRRLGRSLEGAYDAAARAVEEGAAPGPGRRPAPAQPGPRMRGRPGGAHEHVWRPDPAEPDVEVCAVCGRAR